MEVIRRPPDAKGFVLLPKRWIVEQSQGVDRFWRGLVADYEVKLEHARAWLLFASIRRFLRIITV